MAVIALVVHQDRPRAAEVAREVSKWLRESGHEVRLAADDALAAGLDELGVVGNLVEGLDLAVSLGGDGTMLRTVALVATAEVPVLGVNSWDEVAAFSQKQRRLVLKISGFHETAWGSRGVHVGHDISQAEWAERIRIASEDFDQQPWIMQSFSEGRLIEHPVYREDGSVYQMKGRVRLCPYYFTDDQGKTSLAGALATLAPADTETFSPGRAENSSAIADSSKIEATNTTGPSGLVSSGMPSSCVSVQVTSPVPPAPGLSPLSLTRYGRAPPLARCAMLSSRVSTRGSGLVVIDGSGSCYARSAMRWPVPRRWPGTSGRPASPTPRRTTRCWPLTRRGIPTPMIVRSNCTPGHSNFSARDQRAIPTLRTASMLDGRSATDVWVEPRIS